MSLGALVAGSELARLSRDAHEFGEGRIRIDLKNKGDTNSLGKEHRLHFDERAAAINYVLNTGKVAVDILQKWARP